MQAEWHHPDHKEDGGRQRGGFHRISLKGGGWENLQSQADPEKCQAIKDMETPTNTNEVQTFMGMAAQLCKWSPDQAFDESCKHLHMVKSS